MQVIGALQAKAGAKTEYSKLGTLTQPQQFIPGADKDVKWAAWNMDWLEWQGVRQIRQNGRRFIKNIKLANAVIDKSDYIVDDENNEYSDIIDSLTKDAPPPALELKFFPIIPNIINVLEGEFSKRNNKIQFRAVDDLSYNEMLEEKRQMLEDTLVKQAEQKIYQKMVQQGADPNSPEVQQALSPENIKSLPEIEDFFKKNYRNVVEEWAQHQYRVDYERFNMKEMEQRQFKRMLILNREFWHFKMNEDDYNIEEWDPVFTFYHKSPAVNYISEGNWAGKVDLMSVPDVIDNYGYLMSETQLKSLERLYPVRSVGYAVSGTPNDGSFYDGSKSYAENAGGPSLGFRQMASMHDNWVSNGDIVQWLMSESEDMKNYGNTNLVRVTTIYWKTQRRLFHLTKVKEDGETIQDIVDESYKVTCDPIYDTSVFKTKTKENLVYGEHLDAIWINETWGGVKIGPNRPTSWAQSPSEVNPIYLGINQPEPGRLAFQFKGDNNLYGCKLPVEGAVFTDRNIKSVSLVDRAKPFQVGYNMVNNQISDILVDELGTVILLDQNALPKNSMGESWGKNNMSKAFVAMKNFQILPLDTTLANTEGAMQNMQFSQLNMEQTGRLKSRVDLALYFKQACFEVVGITPQRLGEVTASESATGTQQATNGSFAQTENLFIQHSDWLMKRVHQMRTDLAQHYNSTKPSVRLQYTTSTDERVNFEINGTSLLTRDLNVFITMDAQSREILLQMKQLAMQNNTAGASIYDLGSIIKSDSIAELETVLKKAEAKQMAQMAAQREQEATIEQERLAQEQKQFEEAQAREDKREEERNKTDIIVAEIRSAGFPDTSDNGHDEYMDRLNFIQGQQQFKDTMDQKREADNEKRSLEREKMGIQREKIAAERDRSNKMIQAQRIASKNKPTPKK